MTTGEIALYIAGWTALLVALCVWRWHVLGKREVVPQPPVEVVLLQVGDTMPSHALLTVQRSSGPANKRWYTIADNNRVVWAGTHDEFATLIRTAVKAQ